ncbi:MULTISPECIES: ABC transporter ATP-binding protein [unclassified Nocardioides]|uniref:ABC transporter ATP-binding protein n=1 Tax=unclassified Nocardioides TaxID=2615069 RepID=UPI003609572B
MSTGTPLLQLAGLHAFYDSVECLHGVDLTVGAGEVVVVLGPNGAGKTTLLRSICRMVRTTGEIVLDGRDVRRVRTDQLVGHGVAMVPQGRGTFVELDVEDNLRAGALTRPRGTVEKDIAHWFEVFPRLARWRHTLAGSLSGGEQQMLAIARAMMSHPRLLLLDEPSLGLAPVVTARLFEVLAETNVQHGTALVIVEQNAELALDIAHRGHVLEAGSFVAGGSAEELRDNDAIRMAYLGY